MRKLQDAQGLDQLIEAGSDGFLPLFYEDWIYESFNDSSARTRISFTKAAENVHKVYKTIEKHQSIERKKNALWALSTNERSEFILSFLKMVEYRTLNKVRELH